MLELNIKLLAIAILIRDYSRSHDKLWRQETASQQGIDAYPFRLTAKKFLFLIPLNESNQTARRIRYVCSCIERLQKERSDTCYQFTECDAELCTTEYLKDFYALQKIDVIGHSSAKQAQI